MTEEKDLPSEIISVIDEVEKFQNVFLSYPTEIDFQTRKIILYLFTDLNAGNGCYLTCMKQEAKTLNVSVLHGMFLADKSGDPAPPMSSGPKQRALAIEIDQKTEFENVQLILNYME